ILCIQRRASTRPRHSPAGATAPMSSAVQLLHSGVIPDSGHSGLPLGGPFAVQGGRGAFRGAKTAALGALSLLICAAPFRRGLPLLQLPTHPLLAFLSTCMYIRTPVISLESQSSRRTRGRPTIGTRT